MKHLARLMSLLVLVSAGIFFANCDGGNDPGKTEEEKQLDKLAGNWTVTGMSFEGSTARQDEFLGANLNISTNKEFTFTNDTQIEASPWPDNSEWEFGANVLSDMTRFDPDSEEVPLTYEVDGTTLTITIANYSGAGWAIGRTKSVDGDWEFTFLKN